MATFYPPKTTKNPVKETINVDTKTKHSSQQVILCNPANKFYGEFLGSADLSNVTIKNGKIED